MNQFIAIMKESLWSTLATKLLYFEIVGVVLVLLALFPLTYEEQVRFEVSRDEIRQPVEAVRYWVTAYQRPGQSTAKWLAEQLPPEKLAALVDCVQSTETAPTPAGGRPNRAAFQTRDKARAAFLDAANYLITETRLYDDPYWEEKIDNRQTQGIWERRGTLTEDYRKRLNRLLVQEGFRGQLSFPSESTAMLMYGTFRIQPLMMSGLGLEEIIRAWLPFLLDKVFLTIGVLLAILVTAPMIPQMLEEGSLYLLLSKPVSRVFLLLSKFVGSGILIFIISSLFLSGLWLILGVRFGVWMSEILWCIPLAVTIFLVYYSVTVGVGLVFRNVILSIIATILFAGICYLLSFSRYTYSGLVGFQRTATVQTVGDQIVRRSAHNHLKLLNPTNVSWDSSMMELGGDMPPEVFDSVSMIMPTPRGAEPFLIPDLNLVVGELQVFPPRPDRQRRLFAARVDQPNELQKPKTIGDLPFGALGFWTDAEGRLETVTSYGSIYRLAPSGQQVLSEAAQGRFPKVGGSNEGRGERRTQAAAGSAVTIDFGDDDPAQAADSDSRTGDSETDGDGDSAAETLEWVAVGMIAYDGPQAFNRVVRDPESGTLYVLGRSSLTRAKRDAQGNYQLDAAMTLPWDWTLLNRIPLGLLNGKLLLPLRGRELLVLDAATFEPTAEFQMPQAAVPLSLATSDQWGQAVVVYNNGQTWVYRESDPSFRRERLIGGAATAATFDAQQRLILAYNVDDLAIVDLEKPGSVQLLRSQKNLIRTVYDWVVEPVYTVFPKPNECYVLIENLMNDGAVDKGRTEELPTDTPLEVDTFYVQSDSPWDPIRSSVIFAAVVMLFNSLYFWRQEY
jgi:ABC-type transport system involved in multi-copper enzyme maturation permease subunit